jgi:hypothetical protein
VLQATEGDARTDFHSSISGWDGVVEERIVGKVAHGKTVEPLQQARLALAVFFVLDTNFSDVHGGIRLTKLEAHDNRAANTEAALFFIDAELWPP